MIVTLLGEHAFTPVLNEAVDVRDSRAMLRLRRLTSYPFRVSQSHEHLKTTAAAALGTDGRAALHDRDYQSGELSGSPN